MEKTKIKQIVDENLAEFQKDPEKALQEASKKIADEATEFIKKNPWVAVLGAAAIGYLLGVTRGVKR